MSFDLTNWVWKEADVPRAKKLPLLVLLRLADYADDDGLCWPSVTSLARDCRSDRRTIQRTLEELEELGLLVRLGTRFRVLRGEGRALMGAQPSPGAQPSRGEGSEHAGWGQSPHKPSEEPSVDPSQESAPARKVAGIDVVRRAHSAARNVLRDARLAEKEGRPGSDLAVADAKKEVDRLAAAIRRMDHGNVPTLRQALGSDDAVVQTFISEFDAVEITEAA